MLVLHYFPIRRVKVMVLAKEYEYFAGVKDELLKHYEGKFALIYGSELVGVWDSQAELPIS